MISPYDKPSTRQRRRMNNSSHHKKRPNTGLAYDISHKPMEHAMHQLSSKGNKHYNSSNSFRDDKGKFLLDIKSSKNLKNSSHSSSSNSYMRARENMKSSGSKTRRYIPDLEKSMGAGNSPDGGSNHHLNSSYNSGNSSLSNMFRSFSRKGLRGQLDTNSSHHHNHDSTVHHNSNSRNFDGGLRRNSRRDIGGAGSGIIVKDNFLGHRPNSHISSNMNIHSNPYHINNSRNHSRNSTRGGSISHHSNSSSNHDWQLSLPEIHKERKISKKMNNANASTALDNLDLQDVAGETCGVCTIKGLKPGNPKWQNQDNFVITENIDKNKNVHLFGVFDGHGELGHLVSQRIREELPKHLIQSNLDPVKACKIMQKDLHNVPFDASCSGATCVITVQQGNHLKVGNLGDSRCVLGRIVNGLIVAVPLSRDHKPDRPDEHQRIVQCGGQVGCRQVILSQRTSNPLALPMGPPRLWYQARGETMGLAMSRSLGDTIVHTVGGSSEAEIMEHTIEDNDRFMLLASDGVWDVVDNNQACQIVNGYIQRTGPKWDPTEAANLLSRFARHRWSTVSNMIDDITCMVVKIKKQEKK